MRARPALRSGAALVEAARAGDRDALGELLRLHLPLVYNLVRRALNGGPDVDDVVQDVMLRAVRQLPELRSAESFRPWLAAIAVRQVGIHLDRNEAAARRFAGLEEIAGRPDAAAEVEGASLLRVELAEQRRQVMHASRWLAADDRTLLTLWWLETVGELSRAELAAALGEPVAHAGVRLQRMRDQLELSRSIVAALEAVPGCERLDDVVADWDGTPSPFWRKRIARHTRSCMVCGRAARDAIPTDRLLLGLLLFPVPAALLAHDVFAGAANAAVALGGVKTWLAGKAALTVLAGTAVVGVTATTTGWPTVPHTAPAVIAAPRPPGTGVRSAPPVDPSGALPPAAGAGAVPAGAVSLESGNAQGRFVSVGDGRGTLRPLSAASPASSRRTATFEVVRGLAEAGCYSFRAVDGRYLRHSSFRLRLSPDEGTVLFRRDATFCARVGAGPGSVSLESHNFAGYFVRHLGDELWVDQFDGSAGFRADSSFAVRPALG